MDGRKHPNKSTQINLTLDISEIKSQSESQCKIYWILIKHIKCTRSNIYYRIIKAVSGKKNK